MTNEQMKPARFQRWAAARKLVAAIQQRLREGGVVIVSTHLKAWQFDKPKHVEFFKATPTGAMMRHGKSWVDIDGAKVRFARWQEVGAA